MSSNAEISGVFCKGSRHAVRVAAHTAQRPWEATEAVTVASPNASFTATVDETGRRGEATSYVMACSLHYQRCRQRRHRQRRGRETSL
ncbi:MAG: hypothetical protein ACLTDR_15040 [Adlercreutzia equolifaciens]